jgi:hypothetical protein
MLMKEDDPLNSVLREWQAPEPSSAVDARVRAAYRSAHRPSLWRRIWSAQVTIPVPVLAAALLLLLAPVLWIQLRPRPPAAQPSTVTPAGEGYMTRVETAGFKPLPDGATRVIRSGEWKP